MNKKSICEKLNWKEKVVVTGGMPNGNKPFHIGHIGAVHIWADFFTRFAKSVLGDDNVVYVSGTDGFGSSTEEKYRELKEKEELDISLEEYITHYHNIQTKTLEKYNIDISLFSASCIGDGFEYHKETSHQVFLKLLKNGFLKKKETLQFYDTKLGVVLNGRQVEGTCPIDGCKSDVAYADECSLGHQYSPSELVNPVSKLSRTKPELRKVGNYYLDLDAFRELIKQHVENLSNEPSARPFMIKEMKDYLTAPKLFISQDVFEAEKELFSSISCFNTSHEEKKERYVLSFATVAERDAACDKLDSKNIQYKGNKTLAPLRISGNAKWGVPLPEVAGDSEAKDLTFYVWPESLWAPISFTKQYLDKSKSNYSWQDFWCSDKARVYQFIGEDNIYFYSLAQTAIFLGLQQKPELACSNGALRLTNVVANKHYLVGGAKASSSGKSKSPTADNLTDYYTVEQIKCHCLAQNFNTAAVNFRSKVFQPEEFEKSGDPMVAQGNILTNYFNRIIRSAFYTMQFHGQTELPSNAVSDYAKNLCEKTMEEYISKINCFKFNEVMVLLEEYFKQVNLNWAEKSKNNTLENILPLVADTIQFIKTGLMLVNAIAPSSVELVLNQLNVGKEFIDWDNASLTVNEIYKGEAIKFKQLAPKVDFFKKHESQIK